MLHSTLQLHADSSGVGVWALLDGSEVAKYHHSQCRAPASEKMATNARAPQSCGLMANISTGDSNLELQPAQRQHTNRSAEALRHPICLANEAFRAAMGEESDSVGV